MKILVGIPAYNCEKQIVRVIRKLSPELLSRVERVMVIDNGSTDNTIAAAIEAAKGNSKIEIWQNDNNYNLGGTHKVAFLAAEQSGCDYVAIVHGDDQAEPQELTRLIGLAEKNPRADAILGARFMSKSKLIGYDKKRIYGNKVLNLLYTIVTLKVTKDLGSGLNLFKLASLSDHNYLGFNDSLTFNLDLLLDYYRKNMKLIYVPITWREEDQISNARNFKIAWGAFTKVVSWRFGLLNYPEKTAKDYTSTRRG